MKAVLYHDLRENIQKANPKRNNEELLKNIPSFENWKPGLSQDQLVNEYDKVRKRLQNNLNRTRSTYGRKRNG